MEILSTNSNRSFETCVVGAQKNRLIEMAVWSTLNFCMGVEIFNSNSNRSFETCVVGAQKNRLIEIDVLSTPNFAWVWRFFVQIPIYFSRHVLLVL